MQSKLAFFDVDGTLSAPCYLQEDGRYLIGVTDEEWQRFLEKTGEDAYRDCAIVPAVRDFARSLLAKGVRLFVLSSTSSETESKAKIKFINRRYPNLFEEYYFTATDAEKLRVMEEKAAAEHLTLSDCILVEDTYQTLLNASPKGVICIHVANLMAGNATGDGVHPPA
ncbi:MAG: hypothetical protein IJR00_04975 [Lachnospiraceae bacterium]|nr:hypothetical protein [Lachnospiraceae bacterium]